MVGFFSNLRDDISSKFNEWKEERRLEKEEKAREKEEQRLKEEEEKRLEEEQKKSNNEQMDDTANQVDGLVNDKFKAFYTLKDFLSNFWDAISNSSNTQPEFKITLPAFCGGGTYNVFDFSFYNNYREYIHGLIAGISYFIYIKRIMIRIPTIIHN